MTGQLRFGIGLFSLRKACSVEVFIDEKAYIHRLTRIVARVVVDGDVGHARLLAEDDKIILMLGEVVVAADDVILNVAGASPVEAVGGLTVCFDVNSLAGVGRRQMSGVHVHSVAVHQDHILGVIRLLQVVSGVNSFCDGHGEGFLCRGDGLRITGRLVYADSACRNGACGKHSGECECGSGDEKACAVFLVGNVLFHF